MPPYEQFSLQIIYLDLARAKTLILTFLLPSGHVKLIWQQLIAVTNGS